MSARIEEKFKKFLESWSNQNAIETEKMIKDNILNLEYFKAFLGINILKQDFVIRKEITEYI